jgi:hypothetical protein
MVTIHSIHHHFNCLSHFKQRLVGGSIRFVEADEEDQAANQENSQKNHQ